MRLPGSPEQWDSDHHRSICAKEELTVDTGHPTRVSIVATPDAMVSPVSGLFETLRGVGSMAAPEDRDQEPGEPFEVEIVAERAGPIEGPSGLTISAQRSVGEVEETDVVIVPSVAIDEEADWVPGALPGDGRLDPGDARARRDGVLGLLRRDARPRRPVSSTGRRRRSTG